MTDYLTQLLDPGADALERALRQAENALAGGKTGETETEGEELAPVGETVWTEPETATAETDLSPKERAGLPQGLPQEATQEAVNGALWDGAGDGAALEFAGSAEQPAARLAAPPTARTLAGALQQADRSAAQAAALTGRERNSTVLERLTAEGSGWTAPGRARQNPTGGGGDLDTAQRVDRAFRRDSRRYDGGFFLY